MKRSGDRLTFLTPATSFEAAIAFLREAGYRLIANGDWALVFSLADAVVLRITPYDQAFLHFAKLCMNAPNDHLPQITSVQHLSRNANAICMPRYEPCPNEVAVEFIESLRSDFNSGDGMPRTDLARILWDGCRTGESIPYFAGVDWNPDNVMLNGDNPVLIDAYYQRGVVITDLIEAGTESALSREEREDLMKIPYHNPEQVQD